MRRFRKWLRLVSFLLLFGALLSACGETDLNVPDLSDAEDGKMDDPSSENEGGEDNGESDGDNVVQTVTRTLLSSVKDVAFADMCLAASSNNPVSFKQNVNDVMEGTTIKRIGIPVLKISDPTRDCMTELHLVTDTIPTTVLETYPLVIPADTYATDAVKEWVYFDLNISVGKGQTLAFGSKSETILWGYANTTVVGATAAVEESRGCHVKVDTASAGSLEHSLLFDITYETKERQNMNTLDGKYISILGASTSTFHGFSNSALYNSTIVDNAQHYPKTGYLTDVNETWWMKTINDLGLRLCVNNSWSGSCVTTMVDGKEKAACMDRATQLHNDVRGIEPDIIVLIIGGNDALRGYEIGGYRDVSDIYNPQAKTYTGDCTLFGQAYATMVHKVTARYPNADVYVCSMLHWEPKHHNKSLEPYNEMIRRIADELGVTYVDLYNGTEISPATKDVYIFPDAIHPNQAGFAQMSECISRALRERYRVK